MFGVGVGGGPESPPPVKGEAVEAVLGVGRKAGKGGARMRNDLTRYTWAAVAAVFGVGVLYALAWLWALLSAVLP